MESTCLDADALDIWDRCSYNPLTGTLYKRSTGESISAQSYIDPRNYRGLRGYILLNRGPVCRNYSRLVYLWIYGYWPPSTMHIDHTNRDSHDNRHWNIRCVTVRENNQNRSNQKSPGIYWNTRLRKWQAQIRIGTTRKYLGVYKDEGDALAAYIRACEENGYAILDRVYERLAKLRCT